MSTKSEAYAAYLKDIYAEYDALADGVVANADFTLSAEEGGYEALGIMGDGDIMAIAFIVMMEAAKSAREDLRALMEQIKAANQTKERLRENLRRLKEQQSKLRDELRDENDGDSSSQAEREGAVSGDPCGVLDTDLVVQTLIRVAARQSDNEAQALADEALLWRERRRQAKKRGASRDELDSLSEISELAQLRLQMLMDRRSKAIETLSNLLKKMSETQEAIVGNLK